MTNKSCSKKDCSLIWREKNKNHIKYSCNSNCYNSTLFPFEYNNSSYGVVDYYINKKDNFRITIFKDWFCTKELLQYDYYEINTSKIYNK